LNGFSKADVTVQAHVSVGSSGVQEAGLVARYGSDGSYYWGVLVGVNGAYDAEIYRFTPAGGFTLLNNPPAKLTTGTGTLKFKVTGSTLELSLDGTVVASATDSALTKAGSVGVRGFGATTFDTFSVS